MGSRAAALLGLAAFADVARLAASHTSARDEHGPDPVGSDDVWTGENYHSEVQCTPDLEGYEEDTRVVLGYGDCQDEAIGGKKGYGSYAHCLRRPSEMYPFLNSTEEHVYVCECNPMFGLGGPDCKQLSASGTLSAALFILNILVDCALAGYAGFLSYHVLKSNKYSINAASATSLLITAGGVSEIARNLSTLLRTLAALDENGFDALLFTLAISTLTVTQGLMSLALAWLDIAEKSKSMKKKGGSLNKSKLILRGFMGFVLVLCGLLMVTGLQSMFPAIAIVIIIILTVAFYVGGKKLIGILNNDKVLTPLIKWLNFNLLCAVPLFIASNVLQIAIYTGIRATGERNLFGMSVSYTMIGLLIAYIGWVVLRFIHISNQKRIDKSRGRVAPAEDASTATSYGNTTTGSP